MVADFDDFQKGSFKNSLDGFAEFFTCSNFTDTNTPTSWKFTVGADRRWRWKNLFLVIEIT